MTFPRPAEAALHEIGFAPVALEDESGNRWLIWVLVILLALLCHIAVSLFHLDWSTPAPPVPVDIHTVDQHQLDQIRKEWAREKNILLDHNKSLPSAATAPKNARYFSDRNIRVRQEQRARITNVMPHPGMPGPPSSAQSQERSAPSVKNPATSLPTLGNLGVPLHLDQKPLNPSRAQQQRSSFGGQDGADQSLLDRDLPQGSQNMLNAAQSVYYSFYSRMYQAIAPIWQSKIREAAHTTRVAAGDYTTVVDVVLDKSGNLIGVKRIRSSGIPAFDRAVDAALAKTGHFPNPPKGLLNQKGEVHTGWTFTVSLQQSTGYDFMPPERVY